MKKQKEKIFSRYQVFIIAVLAFIQFTVILDFMVMAPLGAILLDALDITTAQFGWIVSAYAFSAGISGLLAAGFADKYDRKKLLLFFYTGFVIGTLLCGIASGFYFLLIARIVTGIFGGVMASVSLAIITDLFAIEVRSRVMGFVQMAFAVSQIIGIPVGLYLANMFNWHAPFLLIVGLSIAAGLAIVKWMRPIDAHLQVEIKKKALLHLKSTLTNSSYAKAFLATALLSIGGFLLMPFSTAFLVDNIKIAKDDLPLVFMFTGIASMIILPLVGKISDAFGKLRIFIIGTVLSSIMIIIYTHLSVTPLWVIVVINVIMFAGIMSRMVPATALMTAIPDLTDRGAFMSISSSLQQIAGGIASVFAGFIVIQTTTDGPLLNYDLLGYYCVAFMISCVAMMYIINKHVENKIKMAAAV